MTTLSPVETKINSARKAPIKWLCAQDAPSFGLHMKAGMTWTIGRCDGECGDRTLVAQPERFAGELAIGR